MTKQTKDNLKALLIAAPIIIVISILHSIGSQEQNVKTIVTDDSISEIDYAKSNIKILETNFIMEDYNTAKLWVKVQNTGNKPLRYVEVNFLLYGENHKMIDKELANSSVHLNPNECVKIETMINDANQCKSYNVEITEVSFIE